MTNFESFIKAATGENSLHAIERRTGIARATLTRKLKGIPPIETVVAIIRAYGLGFIETFVAAGYIRQDEAESIAAEGALRKASDVQLAEEILRRANASEAAALHAPIEFELPDYSNMSAQDAKDYGLAAKESDGNIAHDEAPNEA